MTVSTHNGIEDRNQITERFPSWKKLKRASFSYNDIRSIDYSIVSEALIKSSIVIVINKLNRLSIRFDNRKRIDNHNY